MAHPEHEFFFIFDRKWDERFIFSDNITPIVAKPQARHPFLYYLWFEWSIPRVLKKINADLFLSPDAYLSLKTKVKSIPIFHDLNFEHYPKEKISVVYNGANEKFCPIGDAAKEETRNALSDGCPYFIFVGALHPRKNLVRLFQAFDYFKEQHQSNIKLLVVGNKKHWTKEIRLAYEGMRHSDEVIFSGRMSAEDLHKAVAAALAMTYVSYFEGFGIPIIESYNCDTPVITSNVTSMPEVAGDAAILVDPFSVKSIARGLEQVAFDPELRTRMIEKGRERRKMFTWQNSADQLWEVIEKVLNDKK
jgi:glycosyltransferase involved in cell wall biosynthesis